MKRISFVLLAVLAGLLVLGCSGGSSTAVVSSGGETPYRGDPSEVYYMNAFLSGHPFWVGCRLGAEAAAAQLGVTLRYGGEPEYDVNKAVSAFEQIVSTGPKGVLLTCISPEPFIEPINNAIAAGVPVITFDSDSPDSKRLSFVSTDNSFLGSFLCDFMAEKLIPAGGATIGVVGRPDQLNIRQRMDGFAARAAARYPNFKVLDIVDNKGDIPLGTANVVAMLQANSDVSVIFAADGIAASCAVQALEETGRNDIKIMTVDSTQDILDLIKAGKLYGTVAQNTFNMGYWAMMQMYAYVHGLVDPFNNWEVERTSPMPPYINSGVDIVTANNADAFVVPAK
ncbi:MAG: substrate-binding domain-containing protein [Treponema sp.]|jgi:ribose transport system substrate-binding protein|nr:substrate-binding domain-containing protein [Treponema sp.]